jgi:bifunctional non-homologous end joining protein LigD
MPHVASSGRRSTSRFLVRVLPGAKPAPLPGFVAPALATLRSKVPGDAGYVHEAKLDGYRLQATLRDGRVTLYTRTGLDWTNRFPPIAADVAHLPAEKLVIDGEVISADTNGHPSFSALQDDLRRGRGARMVFYAFDLLHLDGFDTRAAPLIERKRVLQSFLAEARRTPSSRVLFSDHFENGAALFAKVSAMGLEGVVSKRADSPYRSGRTEDWIKVKCLKRDDFIIVGFAPEGLAGIAKLRLARREGRALVYVGRVGTGWDRKTAAMIRRTLEPLARPTCPLAEPIKRADTTWVDPRYEADVVYSEVTNDGMLRHPAFKGMRTRGGSRR